MLKLKLSKIGKRTQPKFRLIVAEQSKDPWGDVKEYLGSYDPKTKKNDFDLEKVKVYLKNGAQATDTVHNLLVTLGVITEKKRNVTLITKERRAKMSADAEALVAKEKADIEKKEAAIRAEVEAKEAAAKAEQEASATAKAMADEKEAQEAKAVAEAAAPAPEVLPEVPATPEPTQHNNNQIIK